MLDHFRKKRIEEYSKDAMDYVIREYVPSVKSPDIHYCIIYDEVVDEKRREKDAESDAEPQEQSSIRYSDRTPSVSKASPAKVSYSLKTVKNDDLHNVSSLTHLLRNYSANGNHDEILKSLEESVEQTFVGKLLYYINKKGFRDSEVYKAAQVDKRLFSKMVSNSEYKPSKDTAIALALALRLSLDEASDMLSRAGYTFSHSSKRDILIEFFFREKIYNLIDVNDVLYNLNQKPIGRF